MEERPEAPRTCPNCGTPVTASDTFCPVCGTDLRGTPPDSEINQSDEVTVPNLPTAEPAPQAPVFEPLASSDTTPAGEPAPPPEPPTRSEPTWVSPTPPGDYQRAFADDTPPRGTGGGNNRVWWIVGIIVVLFFLACCCLAVILAAVASSDSALHDELETATASLAALLALITR